MSPQEPPEPDVDGQPDSARTVFIPAAPPPAPEDRPTAPTGSPPPPSGHAATVFMPPPSLGAGFGDGATPEAAGSAWGEAPPEVAVYVAPPEPAALRHHAGRIAPGVVLNHIYEVRRFLAAGGMGEVYEGVNAQTEERVAIKVILPHLAMDPAVQAMFRKEARTLTRLSHPGLVQYRVLAQEPTLGVLYIVTEFIDGGQLSDYIGVIHPGAEQIEQLLRRLASGLEAAHELGAVHRDMSPDNVLLPEGRLDQAKVIDFGIAKDLDGGSKTIVGDGFAGKLGFVAPEQFGDFDREVGPWTDVYSLALVLLTVAAGKPVDMGATLVDAIDFRRKGPDLSPVPERLRPVFEGMLKANPKERFRSMREVLNALDGAPSALAAAAPSASSAPPPPARAAKSPVPLIAGGVAAVAVLAAVGAFVFFSGHKAGTDSVVAAAPAPASADTEKVRTAVEAALPSAQCTWIDIDDVNAGPGGVSLRLSGVAGSPVEAQQVIQKAAQATGAKVGLIDTANVFPVGAATCAPLDAFRQFRTPNSQTGRLIDSQQSNWELMDKNPPCNGPNAKVVVGLKTGSPDQNFTVLGFDRKGGLQQIFTDKAALASVKAQAPELVTDQGGGAYSTTACYNETGLVGEALVTGAGPFDVDLPNAMQSDKSKMVDAAWLQQFIQKAKAGGWKISMAWYRVVNDQPN